MADPAPPDVSAGPAPAELDFEAFQHIYGPIRALSPAQASELFRGAPFRWCTRVRCGSSPPTRMSPRTIALTEPSNHPWLGRLA